MERFLYFFVLLAIILVVITVLGHAFWMLAAATMGTALRQSLQWFGGDPNRAVAAILPPLPPAAWIAAAIAGGFAWVVLRLRGREDRAAGRGIIQLTLGMALSLIPLVRLRKRRVPDGGIGVARHAEATSLTLIFLVLAAFGYGWAHGVARAVPVGCAALAAIGYFLVAAVGRRQWRDRRGLVAMAMVGVRNLDRAVVVGGADADRAIPTGRAGVGNAAKRVGEVSEAASQPVRKPVCRGSFA